MPLNRLLLVVYTLCGARLADASRKILLLHGSSSTAGAFINRGASSLTGAAASAYHDGGPHAWQFGSLDWDAEIGEVTNCGDWWTSTAESSPEQLAAGDSAVSLVEETLRSGGFNGIVGFSHGALLASVVAARAALGKDGCYSGLEFAVFCAGAIAEPYAETFEELANTPPALRKVQLPTLHCLSEADDTMPPDQGALLAGCFGGDCLWHDAGHAMPGKDECKDIIAWCDEVCPTGSPFAS